MPIDLFANVAETTLSGAITDTATSLTVASSTNFPAASSGATPPTQFRAAFLDGSNNILEYIRVTNVSGTTWTVVREAEDATRFPKAARSNGTKIVMLVTAGILDLIGKGADVVQDIGDGAATSFTIAHNFGTYDVDVKVFTNASPREDEIPDVERPDVNNVTLRFGYVPATNALRVVIKPRR